MAETERETEFYKVAIGSSAGGLEALERFFSAVPADSGNAYIVIQHLSPKFESLMDQLLARKTDLPIYVIEDGLLIEPNHIYLLPPGKEAIVTDCTLYLKDRSPARELTFPIDEFFRSLAQESGEYAIGVVLSGTGTDGSRGIQDIHAAGGLVISQDEETSTFDGMPRSACGTGVVDLVLKPENMAGAIAEYKRDPDHIHTRLKSWVSNGKSMDYMDAAMRRILNLLNARYGLDFTHYKAPTIARRIERRLVLGGGDLDAYANELESDPELVEKLYRDLLVGVTSFFRDRDVWETLELDALPSLIARLGPDEEFRAWVAGTATGEEAYSLAILLIEAFETADRPCKARIFASDVHQGALNRASQGIYSPERVAGLLPGRLERFFEERPEGFRVVPEVRKLVVFTPHNLIHDAPFTRLDLITCRNVLIYFNMATQQKSLNLMSFGLKQRGVLCLGASESLGDLREDFEPIDAGSRIFRKDRAARTVPPPFKPPALQSALTNVLRRTSSPQASREFTAMNPATLLEAYDRVLADFMPPGLLITRSRLLVHAFEGAAKYMVPRDGRPSSDVLDYLDSSLKPAAAAAIRRVCRDMQPVSYAGIRVETTEGSETVRLIVRPYCSDTDTKHVLILFETENGVPDSPIEEFRSAPLANEEVEALDGELQVTRDNLQASIQELQAANEQHQAANEELTAANEELQSTNEELHSVNEELYTVNAEHQRKIDELTELTDDMDNLLSTTNVHTLFLDQEMRLRRFTPRIADFFNLIPQDIGRRIDSFTNNLLDDDLVDEVRSVLETEKPFEREVRDTTECWYLLRIFPYLSRGNVDGVVLTLVDITSLKDAAAALKLSQERFNLAVRGSNEGIWDWEDISREFIWCSKRFYTLLGYDEEPFEMTYSLWQDLLHPDDQERVIDAIENHLSHGTPFSEECRIECRDRSYRWFQCCGAAQRNANGRAVRMAGSLDDITDRKMAQVQVRDAVARRDKFLAMLSHELRNPLGAVLNAVQLLETDQSRTAAANVIRRQSQQMARLLDDLLDVSRMAHGKLEMVRESLDLVPLLTHAVDVAPLGDKTDLHLSVEIPDVAVPVYGDAARLEQVFVNLLVNAYKYTPEGGDVSVSVSADEQVVTLEIRDSGVGIPPELIEKIFSMFVQSDETIDRSNGGMGVGLTLVKSVVDLHDGVVTAASDGPGKGSCFTVQLPLAKGPELTKIDSQSPPRSVESVVIVEDIDDARQMLQLLLEAQGYKVSSAEDGKSGLQLIIESAPDVAIVDIGLPGIDGFEVARQLRADSRFDAVRLVALTGYGQATDREAVFAAGFDDHLIKPLQPEELARTLRHRNAIA